MDAITTVRDFIARNPAAADTEVLDRLLQALQQGQEFDLQRLYELDLNSFDLAIDVLNAWRLQRYYRGGAVVAGAAPHGH